MMHMQNFGTSSVPHRPYKCRLTEGGLSVLDSLPMCVGGQLSIFVSFIIVVTVVVIPSLSL